VTRKPIVLYIAGEQPKILTGARGRRRHDGLR
jgi:hypothetical protein